MSVHMYYKENMLDKRININKIMQAYFYKKKQVSSKGENVCFILSEEFLLQHLFQIFMFC